MKNTSIRSKSVRLTFQLSLIIFITIFYSCNREEKIWEKTQKLNNSEAYIEFAKKYPKSVYANEVRAKLKDTLNVLHNKAIKMWEQKNEDKSFNTFQLYSQILQINPNDPLALNNKAVILCRDYYSSHDKTIFNKALNMFEQSLNNTNRHRIKNSIPRLVIEGKLLEIAPPPIGHEKPALLFDVVIHNYQALHEILNISYKKPPKPNNLIITGEVVDTNNAPFKNRRIFLTEVGGSIESNDFTTKTITDNQFRIINPNTLTNEKGQFEFNIKYDDSIFDNLPAEFIILAPKSNEMRLNDSDEYGLFKEEKLYAIEIDENEELIDLGKLQVILD